MEQWKNKFISLLRWSEKYTKTDMVYLAKGGFWMTLMKVFATLSSFGTSIAFANLLPSETYGSYRYILSIFSILAIPTLRGVDTVVIQETAKGNESIFMPAFLTKIKWGTLSSFCSFLVAIYYYLNGNTDFAFSFLIATLFLPFIDSLSLYTAYLNGKKKFAAVTKYQIIINIISAVTIITVILLSKNILFIIFSYFLIYCSLRFIFFKITNKEIQTSDRKYKKEITFGKHLTLINLIGFVSESFDKIMIFNYMNATTLAGYYLAMAPFKQIQSFANGMNTLALPNFSQNNIETIKKTLPIKILKITIPIIIIIIIYYLTSSYIFKFIYPKYIDFVTISNIFMIQFIFYPTTLLFTALAATGKKNYLYFSNTFYSLTRIILLLALVPLYGIYGASWAIVITSFLQSIVLIYLFYRSK